MESCQRRRQYVTLGTCRQGNSWSVTRITHREKRAPFFPADNPGRGYFTAKVSVAHLDS